MIRRGRRTPAPGRVQAPPSYKFPVGPEAMLPWSHAAERLKSARCYWLATTRPGGRPHVTPVWGVWIDDSLYFDGLPTTHWARNIDANPFVAVHLESGTDVVIVEGQVDDLIADADLAFAIVDAWSAKYGRLVPKPATSGIFRLRARTARAWSTETLADGTRWVFPEA